MKNYYCNFLVFVTFFMSSLLVYSQEKTWTLEECIDYAIKNNIQVKQYELEKEAAYLRRQLALGDFLPALDVSGQHRWTIADQPDLITNNLSSQTLQSTSLGLNVNVDIYKGLANHHKMVKARIDFLASEYKSQQMKENIALQVINSYLQIIFNKELVKTNSNQLEYDFSQEERTKDLVDAGVVPAGDLLEAKATVATSTQRLILSENELVMAKLSLAQLLQLESYSTFEVSDSNYEVENDEILAYTPDEIIERAFDALMNIKIAEANLDIADRNVKIARSAYHPTISGFYNFNSSATYADRVIGQRATGESTPIGFVNQTNQAVSSPKYQSVIGGPEAFFDQLSNNKNSVFGVSISIPVFNGFKVRNNLRLSRLAKEQVENEKEVAILELEQQVFRAYTDTKNALKNYEASVLTLESREKSLEYAKERYSVGLINIFELNQNQTLFVTAQSNMLKSKYDYIFKTRILEYYFGIPLFSN
ncbi:TolC family protein [Myroides albus]|nr:TolC family protein [Myroides albus]